MYEKPICTLRQTGYIFGKIQVKLVRHFYTMTARGRSMTGTHMKVNLAKTKQLLN